MIIVKCDRCGAEHEMGSLSMFPLMGGNAQLKNSDSPSYMIVKDEDGKSSSINLCGKCEAALTEWLKTR
jgi:hypothetical protein